MTISLRNLLKAFGAAAGAMCWLRRAYGSWEWRRKLAAMLLVAALALAAGQAETQSARDGRRPTLEEAFQETPALRHARTKQAKESPLTRPGTRT